MCILVHYEWTGCVDDDGAPLSSVEHPCKADVIRPCSTPLVIPLNSNPPAVAVECGEVPRGQIRAPQPCIAVLDEFTETHKGQCPTHSYIPLSLSAEKIVYDNINKLWYLDSSMDANHNAGYRHAVVSYRDSLASLMAACINMLWHPTEERHRIYTEEALLRYIGILIGHLACREDVEHTASNEGGTCECTVAQYPWRQNFALAWRFNIARFAITAAQNAFEKLPPTPGVPEYEEYKRRGNLYNAVVDRVTGTFTQLRDSLEAEADSIAPRLTLSAPFDSSTFLDRLRHLTAIADSMAQETTAQAVPPGQETDQAAQTVRKLAARVVNDAALLLALDTGLVCHRAMDILRDFKQSLQDACNSIRHQSTAGS